MRKFISIAVLGLVAGCNGGHALDSPIKTCKAVTQVLAGDKPAIWHGEQQTEEKGVQLQVTLDFALTGQAEGQISKAICIYDLSSQDMDYRNAMGEYANTPTRMLVNGQAIPSNDLVQAVNRATADTANALGQQAIQKLNGQK